MKKLIFILFLILIISIPIFAQQIILSPIEYTSARIFAIGGALTANPTGFEGIFFNPAGYSLSKNNHFGLIDLNFSFNSDFLSFMQYSNSFQDFETLLGDPEFISILLKMKLGFGLSGIPFVGLMIGGLTLAVYDTSAFSAAIIPTAAIPEVKISSTADVGAVIGYSFKIGDNLHMGANAKLLIRGWADIPSQSLLSIVDTFSQGIEGIPFNLKVGYGFGFDIGALLKLGIVQIGVSVLNIGGMELKYIESNNFDELDIVGLINGSVTPTGTAIIPMQINTGVAIYFGTFIPILMERFVITMDIKSINLMIQDFKEYGFNFSLIGNYFFFGLEFRTLGLLTVRAGLYQGYPTFGLSLNLLLVKLSFAYYTKELGMFPGTLPESNFIIAISLSW